MTKQQSSFPYVDSGNVSPLCTLPPFSADHSLAKVNKQTNKKHWHVAVTVMMGQFST
jgi:hypothetical protein